MANITQINTWQMYAKDGRAVLITYDYEEAPLGVLELSGPYSPGFDTNLEVYWYTIPNSSIGFVTEVTENYPSAWATANVNLTPTNYGRIQFQDGNGWITEYYAMSFFRPIPTGDGYFVLQGDNGNYVSISTTLDTIPLPNISIRWGCGRIASPVQHASLPCR